MSFTTEDLPPADALDGTELLAVVQNGNSRKVALALLLLAQTSAAALTWVPAPGLAAVNLETALRLTLPKMPDHFGAKGDNATDDYQAFQDLSTSINAAGGGRVALRQGATYLINRNLVAGNGVSDIKFVGFNGLVFEGNGAKIRLKSGWDRDVAGTRALCGLRFQDGSNFAVRNFEIDGGSATITNSAAAAPGYSMGLSIESCSRGVVENIYTHHHTSDGFRLDTSATLVGGSYVACKNIVVRNVVSKFNARLGISVIQARGVIFDNCDFSFTAFNDEAGTATTFANGGGPKAGVDIEPNAMPWSATPVDVLTGDITFRQCRIKGNASSSLLAQAMTAGLHRMDQIHIEDCDIDHVDGQTSAGTGFAFDVPDGTVLDSRIDVRDSALIFPVNAVSTARQRLAGNKIYGRMTTVAGAFQGAQSTSGNAQIEDNDFTCTNTAAAPAGARFFRNINTNSNVMRNRFILPAAAFTGAGLMIANTVEGKRAEDNRYETDLASAANYFGVMYGDNTVVRGDRFVGGSADKWAEAIRPGRRTAGTVITWCSDFLFNSNQRMAKVTALDLANVAAGAASPLQTTAVADVAIGDKVEVESSLAHDGVKLDGTVSSAGNVKWWAHNVASGAGWDPAAADYYITVTKRAA